MDLPPYSALPIDDIEVEGVAKLQADIQTIWLTVLIISQSTYWMKLQLTLLAYLYTLIFKGSLHQFYLSQNWKTAHVFLIFKKGPRRCPTNYRPMSLTSTPCKIFEHIVYTSIYKNLEKNSILYNAQHGFRKKCCWETHDYLWNSFLMKIEIACNYIWIHRYSTFNGSQGSTPTPGPQSVVETVHE